jgi:two-component system NarL family sensor kinase
MLRTLMGRVAPAVYNVYLVGRLRSRAGAIERARVARELHDGVIQSLIGIEMRLDVARARATADRSPLEADLVAAQQLLRNEIINVRELMQQLSSIEVRPHQLVELLATMVARFYRETGIHAQFTSALDEVDLTPRACRELVRIVQEALINVRRHSGAQRALVHLAAENGHVRLTVDDDGRGFGFAGRVHHRQLEPEWRGPRVIQERVRSLGGDLTIDSRPGRGARLEIVVPKRHVGSNA